MADAPDSGSVVQDETVLDLDKLYTQAKGLRSRFEPTWFLNLAYYMGDQWVFFNRGRLDRPRLDPWRITMTDNRIIGCVRTELAKLTKQKPVFQVIPTTADDEDLQAARTGEKILEFLWRHLKLRNKQTDVLLWSRVCGAGFWKVTWDPTQGQGVEIVVDQQGQPIIHEETGGPIKADLMRDENDQLPEDTMVRTLHTGDVCVETVQPFDIFPDPIAKEFEDCEWVIQETVKSAEYVRRHFGVSLAPDTEVASGPSESRMFPSFQMGGTSGYRGVKLREYWCKPNTRRPQGRHAVWAQGRILHAGTNPYGCLPYIMFKGVPVPGRFWPTSLVEQLRGPQTELNKIKSQIAENASRLGNPALLVSRQANTNYSGIPGERIDYDDTTPNAIPRYLTPPNMPQYVLEQQDRIEASIEAISGQHEVTNAQVPAGVTAASAINLLLEADDTRLGPAVYDHEECLGYAGEMLLKLCAQYWTDERAVMIAGQDHAWDIIHFRGAALKENTKVEVQAGSAFPQSKAAKQAAIQQVLQLVIQNGLPIPPSQMRKVLRDMEAGGLEKFFDDLSRDEQQANRENQRFLNGDMFNINPWDVTQVHLDIHEDLQKSASWDLLPPQIQQNVQAHIDQHRMFLLHSITGQPQFAPPTAANGMTPPIVPQPPVPPVGPGENPPQEG